MKANELFEQIHSGRIKEGTKIEVIDELTGNCISKIEYKNQRLNWVSGEYDTSFLCNIDINFEVIEENKEIEELEISEKDRKFHSDYINNIADKLNEVIRKINKEREEMQNGGILQ